MLGNYHLNTDIIDQLVAILSIILFKWKGVGLFGREGGRTRGGNLPGGVTLVRLLGTATVALLLP